MYDVTAIGELLIDFACTDTDSDGYPTLAAHPGGAPGNLLAALTAYGCKTALLGKVGGGRLRAAAPGHPVPGGHCHGGHRHRP